MLVLAYEIHQILHHDTLTVQVRQLINILVATSLQQFYEDGAVVPLNLRFGLLLIGCKDNLDLLAQSTTGGASFHGTTISLFQQPTRGENCP